MRRLRFRILRLIATLGVVALIWACNAPFIPVPPPGMIAFTAVTVSDADGGQKTAWVTHGGPNGNAASARFFVFDQNAGTGVIATALPDGSFVTAPMDGAAGDYVLINYYLPTTGDYSATACRVLTPDVPDAPACPP